MRTSPRHSPEKHDDLTSRHTGIDQTNKSLGRAIGELHCDRGYIASSVVSEVITEGGEVICKPWASSDGWRPPKKSGAQRNDGGFQTVRCSSPDSPGFLQLPLSISIVHDSLYLALAETPCVDSNIVDIGISGPAIGFKIGVYNPDSPPRWPEAQRLAIGGE